MMDTTIIKEPPFIKTVNPDVMDESMAPDHWDSRWSHKRYKIIIDKGDPGYAPTFFGGIKKQLAADLPRYVLPTVYDRNHWMDLRKPAKWIRRKYELDYMGWDPGTGDYSRKSLVKWSLIVHPEAEATPKQAFKAMIAGNLAPPWIFSRNSDLMSHNLDPAEAKARGLLRELIGKPAYEEYMRRGFLAVRGPSGILYHIRGGHAMIEARDQRDPSRVSERLCIVFKQGRMPYTDSLIMRLMLVQRDEMGMRTRANVHPEPPPEFVEVA